MITKYDYFICYLGTAVNDGDAVMK